MTAGAIRLPRGLSAEQRRLWIVMQTKLEATALWHPAYESCLLNFVVAVTLLETLRADVGQARDRQSRLEHAGELARTRLIARGAAARLLLLRRRDIGRRNLDAAGRDLDLATIVDPTLPLRPAYRVPPLPPWPRRLALVAGGTPRRTS